MWRGGVAVGHPGSGPAHRLVACVRGASRWVAVDGPSPGAAGQGGRGAGRRARAFLHDRVSCPFVAVGGVS